MPLYEYQCGKCGHVFEKLASYETVPNCPACGAAETEKKITCCARLRSDTGSADAGPASSGSGCGGCMGGNCASCGR